MCLPRGRNNRRSISQTSPLFVEQLVGKSSQLMILSQKLTQFYNEFPDLPIIAYSDGSLSDAQTIQMKMGSGWAIFTEEDPTFPLQPIAEFNCNTELWPSSTKAEIVALYSLVKACPTNRHIKLYTDSQALIDTAKEITLYSVYYQKKKLKMPGHLWWGLIADIIRSQSITITYHKVKGHSNCPQNDYVDELAKKGRSSTHVISESNIKINSTIIQFGGLPINVNVRKFMTSLTAAKYRNRFINLQRFYPEDLTLLPQINWKIAISFSSHTISQNDDQNKDPLWQDLRAIWSVKLQSNELPTLNNLKRRNPDVYGNFPPCALCNSTIDETIDHLWQCDFHTQTQPYETLRYESIDEIIASTKKFLFKQLNITYDRNIDQMTIWSTTHQPHQFTLSQWVKGLIPQSLVTTVSNILKKKQPALQNNQLNNHTTSVKIILKTIAFFKGLFYTNIWLPRCEAFAQYEKSKGIKSSHKKCHQRSSADEQDSRPISITLGQYPDTLYEQWMLNAIHYGYKWEDFQSRVNSLYNLNI